MAETLRTILDNWIVAIILILAIAGVVKSIANRLARRLPPSVETNDLISIGMLGLIDAAGRYRPTRRSSRTYR